MFVALPIAMHGMSLPHDDMLAAVDARGLKESA